MAVYVMCFILFSIGLYSVIVKKNLIKIAIGFMIMEYAINLFFGLVGYKAGGIAPIITEGVTKATFVDPLPQALVLTAIVIGLGTTAVLVAVCVRIYDRYGTYDITEIRRLRG